MDLGNESNFDCLNTQKNDNHIKGGPGGDPLNYGGYKKSAIGGLIGGGGGVEGAKLTKLPNFRTFLNCYFICYKIFALFSNGTIFVLFFSHFAQIGSTVFKATSASVPFGVKKSKGG